MLFRLVRPMFREGSRNGCYNRRIPADVRRLAVGLKLSLPVGEKFVSVTISPEMEAIRLSLRTSDPLEAKARTARLDEHLERAWSRLRENRPVSLSQRQAVALAGELYRAWAAGEGRERTRGMVRIPVGEINDGEPAKEWQWVPDDDPMDDGPELWAKLEEHLARVASLDAQYSAKKDRDGRQRPLEIAFGAIIDGLLSQRAILRIEPASRELLLKAFHAAMMDAAASRERNASGDYSPDPKAARFPFLEESFESDTAKPTPTKSTSRTQPKVSLKGLFKDWWSEAKAAGRTESTHDSYSRTFRLFGEFLGHDDASRISTDDIQRFKDHRREQGASIKTVRDSDISSLKSVFGWAVGNGRLQSNPAANIKMMAVKTAKVRERAFTEDEAKAILRHASEYRPNSARETPKVTAAKRWVPWLCAYSGARVGEIVQLRKEDVELSGSHPSFIITPEAGTVKNKEARQVVIHEHLVALGFLDFVRGSKPGYLFLNAGADDDATTIRGLWRSVKNRLAVFVREVVTDKGVAPNHGWRHTFKMFGGDADMREKVLDAICGHAQKTVGRKYGPVKLSEQAREMAKFPRYEL
jgi:integrase